MELQSATVEQIATFKTAAALRYLERGIDPKIAGQLFDKQMASISQELTGIKSTTGIQRDKVAEKIAGIVNEIRCKK